MRIFAAAIVIFTGLLIIATGWLIVVWAYEEIKKHRHRHRPATKEEWKEWNE